MGDVTGFLRELSDGDPTALDELMPLVYAELRTLARRHLHSERRGHTLTPTALVHEAFLRLADQNRVRWRDRVHFFSYASCAMRRILVSHARRRHTRKRSPDEAGIRLGMGSTARVTTPEELILLDLALQKLEALDRRRAAVVELLFFGGLSQQEVAEVLEVSTMTVFRDWKFAQAWLSRELRAA